MIIFVFLEGIADNVSQIKIFNKKYINKILKKILARITKLILLRFHRKTPNFKSGKRIGLLGKFTTIVASPSDDLQLFVHRHLGEYLKK